MSCGIKRMWTRADVRDVQLTQCPYDGTALVVETVSGGSILLSCVTCDAAWERHGAWVSRFRAPNPQRVRAAREENGTSVAAAPTA